MIANVSRDQSTQSNDDGALITRAEHVQTNQIKLIELLIIILALYNVFSSWFVYGKILMGKHCKYIHNFVYISVV